MANTLCNKCRCGTDPSEEHFTELRDNDGEMLYVLCSECWRAVKDFIENDGGVWLDDFPVVHLPPISSKTYKLVPVDDE